MELCPSELPTEEVRQSLASYLDLNLSWVSIAFVQTLSFEVMSKLQSVTTLSYSVCRDKPKWNLEGNGVFSSRSMYRMLLPPPTSDQKSW